MEKQVSVGKVADSMEKLMQLCNEKAEQMTKTMAMNNGESQEVSFWTDDIPELICVGKFVKGNDGKTTYNLDFSQSTL